VLCASLTSFRFTPQVGAGGTVEVSERLMCAAADCVLSAGDPAKGETGPCLRFCALHCPLQGRHPSPAPEFKSAAELKGAVEAARREVDRRLRNLPLAVCEACSCKRGYSGRCVDCGKACGLAAEPVPAPSEDLGRPFGVEIAPLSDAVVHNLWGVQVRDARGVVAYVSIGLASQDAARWAALSWLRGQAKYVANEDAEALRSSFEAESLKAEPQKYEAPTVVQIDPRDPLAVLMNAKMGEPLRDRLLAYLKEREHAWEDLADASDSDAFTVAVAKDHADADVAALLAVLG
jgi:hypothetical protein